MLYGVSKAAVDVLTGGAQCGSDHLLGYETSTERASRKAQWVLHEKSYVHPWPWRWHARMRQG